MKTLVAMVLNGLASLVAQTVKIYLKCRRPGLNLWVREMPWGRAWKPIPVFWPWESYDQRNLVGYSPWGCKESDTTERLTLWVFHSLRNAEVPMPLPTLSLLTPCGQCPDGSHDLLGSHGTLIHRHRCCPPLCGLQGRCNDRGCLPDPDGQERSHPAYVAYHVLEGVAWLFAFLLYPAL